MSRPIVVLLALMMPVFLAGCGRSSSLIDTLPAAREIDLAAFADPGAAPEQAVAVASSRSAAAIEDPRVVTPAPPRLGAGDARLAVAEPTEVQPRPGEPVFIDRMVGQVNGRPVYAHEFFEPLDDQLRQLARENARRPRQFVNSTYEIVANRLREIVLDQLFLAEAEAGLTDQEQQGVRYFLTQLEEQLVLEGEGSRTQIESELLEEEGLTIEGYLDERRREILIGQVYREKVLPRVIVSWRDIEREYKRRFDEFNPDAEVIVHRIRIPTSRTEQVQDVKDRLARGDSFATVADALEIDAEARLWGTFTMGEDAYAEIENEAILGALQSLSVGQTSAPFQIGRSTWWLHIAEVTAPEQLSLYDPDLQRALQAELLQKRQGEEQQIFIQQLFARGVFDELEEMIDRLTDMAVKRYLVEA